MTELSTGFGLPHLLPQIRPIGAARGRTGAVNRNHLPHPKIQQHQRFLITYFLFGADGADKTHTYNIFNTSMREIAVSVLLHADTRGLSASSASIQTYPQGSQ